mmetsp:Transcript_92426/g.298757  ORF Transcript_92426/g.298757 Transcript_92426/m.298757 type:complete len:109 (+) Transcript_92426:356-682(+)
MSSFASHSNVGRLAWAVACKESLQTRFGVGSIHSVRNVSMRLQEWVASVDIAGHAFRCFFLDTAERGATSAGGHYHCLRCLKRHLGLVQCFALHDASLGGHSRPLECF